MAKTLYLTHAASPPRRAASIAESRQERIQWLFLCQDYSRLLAWERALGASFTRVPTRPGLVSAAARLRRPFLDLVTALGKKHNSVPWWASRVSERNTGVSWLFLYCCYLRVGQEQLGRGEGPLVVIGESWAVLAGLAAHASQHGWTVRWLSRQSVLRRYLRPAAGRLLRVARFFARSMLQAIIGPSPTPLPPNRRSVMLHTFVDEQSLRDDGEFEDRYFPGLRKWLEGNGFAVTHMPILSNLRRGYVAGWRWLAASRQHFINPFRLYRLTDYLAALTGAARSWHLKLGVLTLDGLDVSELFSEARANQSYDTLDELLSNRLPLRLSERGIRLDLFIAEYENMIPEKLLIAGFREHAPDTKLVGFQHGAVYPMMLCSFVTAGEAEFAPLPDRVVCNGPFFRDLLVAEGLPSERAIAGPALRYTHLWRQPPDTENQLRSGVFAPLPMMARDAAELLTKLMQAFGSESEVSVSLKPHPMTTSLTPALDRAGVSALPSNFQIVSGDFNSCLARSQVVVALSSSALYEAVAAGVPVVIVGREAALDLNPLAWHDQFNREYCSPEEIHAEAVRLMTLRPDELRAYQAGARAVLAASFGPVNDSAMRSFIVDP